MYALEKSVFEKYGEYRVEVYIMEFYDYEVSVYTEIKIFGEGINESYLSEFEIRRDYKESLFGVCANQPTKEATLLEVERMVIQMLEDEKLH